MDQEDLDRIEAEAAKVLAGVPEWLWDGSTLPVPVEAIVDSHFDLLVLDVEPEEMAEAPGFPALDEDSSVSGLFLPAERQIWVNAEEAREWPARRRFTIGHELGHCVLHERGQRSLFCRHGQVDFKPGEEAPTQEASPRDDEAALEIEREANHFAAALLMPPELMREQYRATKGSFDEMCRVFGSSGAAMGRRMHQAVPRGG